MLVSVISIGNSKGIRLPKTILEECHIEDQLELEVDHNEIILKPVKKKARAGWSAAFLDMHHQKDDHLLISESFKDDIIWEW